MPCSVPSIIRSSPSVSGICNTCAQNHRDQSLKQGDWDSGVPWRPLKQSLTMISQLPGLLNQHLLLAAFHKRTYFSSWPPLFPERWMHTGDGAPRVPGWANRGEPPASSGLLQRFSQPLPCNQKEPPHVAALLFPSHTCSLPSEASFHLQCTGGIKFQHAKLCWLRLIVPASHEKSLPDLPDQQTKLAASGAITNRLPLEMKERVHHA